MSELFDDDPRATPPPTGRSGRRSRALLITAGVVIAAIFALTAFASLYTDRLWYQSAGYGNVFSTLLWTRVGLFLVFAVVLGGVVALNIYLAYRFRPLFRPASREQSNLDRYRDVVTPLRTWVLIGVAVVLGVFAGTSGMGHWRTFMLWRNAQDFGTKDPYFGKDIGYFVFHLPWQHYLVDFLMATIVIALIAALVTHYLYGGIRLQSGIDRLSGAAQVQVSVLLGLFVLAKGVDYYLDRFDLAIQKNGLFTGMNFTADNAVLPSKNILMGVAIICAILFFLNVWRRTWQLPSVGLALFVLSAILLGMIWPAIVQQFQVKPSEADKERPYIEKNISSTRAAYDLTDIEKEQFEPNDVFSAAQISSVVADTSSIPLVDPNVVQAAFQNIQQGRTFYDTADVLDVDRYEINGTDRALVLGVRELDQSRINEDDRNWSNLHTVYTHGNGIIAAYANQRGEGNGEQQDAEETTEDGGLEWAQGTRSHEDDLQRATGGFETRVYYGERSPSYSVVGKKDEDANDVELNLPTPGSDEETTTTYDGPADASVGSAFNQLMFAIKFGEPNFLLSGRVHENSSVLYNREPVERVEKVAPWLTVDADPYPAVVDGKIQWILDGYTTTDRFPGAQKESFETMTDDALQVDTGIQTLPTDEINYMRNAVKATVDAYTGDVVLYAWDENDPMLKAWMGAFPNTVLPASEMSDELLDHVRYPEDLFKVQRYQFARYHVTDADDWYQGNNRWEVPVDPYATNSFQAPNRLLLDDPLTAEVDPRFALTSVYVPYGKANLASYMSVNSGAGEGYGKIRVLELPTNDQTPGPGQVSNEFQSEPRIADALAEFNRSGAEVTAGNILTFPINDGLMYVQPIYAERSGTDASYPVLRYVLAKFGDDIGWGPTFREALQDLFGATSGGSTGGDDDGDGGEGDGGDGDGPVGTLQEQLDDRLADAIEAFEEAQTALQEGRLGDYQDLNEEAEAAIEDVIELRNRIDAEQGGGADTPTDAPTDEPTDGASDEAAGE